MSAPFSARPPLWLQTVLIALMAMVVTAGLFGRWSWQAWTQPHWLEGDPLEVYARVKIAGEQPGAALLDLRSVAALGAPTGADWRGYPAPDRIVFVLTGLLGRPLGLIAAIQLMSAAIFALNAVSFYLCARWLRWRWVWAAALALTFAFCTYNLRWGITLSFSQTFTLPPLVLLCARAVRRGPRPTAAWPWLAVGLGLWLAQGNPYLAYFSGFVATGALLLGLARRSPGPRLRLVGLFLIVLTAAFLVLNTTHLHHLLTSTGGATLVRSLDDVRTYALRPVEWFIPPADHRMEALGGIGRAYLETRQGRGEFFYNYLGLAGVVALGGLLVTALGRLRRKPRRISDSFLGLVWITAFGVVGGINFWLGAAGLDIFRAGTRIGIFAEVWVLFFLGSWLTNNLRSGTAALCLAPLLTCAALWDQTPPLADPSTRVNNRHRWEDYATLAARLEQSLPAGAMIFQLPAVPFPEAGRVGAMPDYEHLRPSLASSSLRYSYGQLRGSPVLRWARHIGRQTAAPMIEALEKAGFAALWIDTRAYPDAAADLLAKLHATGRREFTTDRQPPQVRIFLLNPSSAAQLPDFADPRFSEPWNDAPSQPALLALEGWYAPERKESDTWRWAARRAALGIWTETAAPDASLRFRLGGPAQSVVVLHLGGRELLRASPGPQIHTLRLPLDAGLNRLNWQLEGATFRPGDHDPRELGFMVENLSVSAP